MILERDLEVNRSNKKLLEKLVEISKGRHVSKERNDLTYNGEKLFWRYTFEN